MKISTLSLRLFLAIALLITINSCNDDDPTKATGLPVITTSGVTTITKTTAIAGGDIVSDGNASIIESGICLSTIANPTIGDEKIVSGTDKGSFTADLTRLSINTTYHVRAFATNANGTAYGNDVSFATGGIDIYLAGGKENDAGYWKNGDYTALTTNNIGSFAYAIAVSGNDVYAAGYSKNFLVLWKNGVMTKITDGTKVWFGVHELVVSGSDVYMAGYEQNSEGIYVAKYWKNGTAVLLGNGANSSEATGIVVSGSDVYVSGYENVNNTLIARYWKNGTGINLTDGTKHGYATSIFLKGNDVYVAGYERSTINDGIVIAKYWKNGVAVSLSNGVSHHAINDIVVTDTEVITVGYNYGTSLTSGNAVRWKNETMTSLTNNSTNNFSTAQKIQISGDDEYIYGYTSGFALVWKNGTLMEPYNGSFPDTNMVADMFIADK